jgi:hypothetical protein
MRSTRGADSRRPMQGSLGPHDRTHRDGGRGLICYAGAVERICWLGQALAAASAHARRGDGPVGVFQLVTLARRGGRVSQAALRAGQSRALLPNRRAHDAGRAGIWCGRAAVARRRRHRAASGQAASARPPLPGGH